MSEGDGDDTDRPSVSELDGWEWVDRSEEAEDAEQGQPNRESEDSELPDEAARPGPPASENAEEDAEAFDMPPPGQTSIRDLKPRYQTNTSEFYFLWFLALLTYGIGDSVTTGMVLMDPTVSESNPLVSVILQQFGLPGFVILKLIVFAVLVLIGVKGAIDRDLVSYYGPPVFATLIGTALTLWNLNAIPVV